jgi:hypothetical protein
LELQAVLEYTFMKLGAQRPSYGSIVGSGQNGTQLHYMKDRGETKPGDLVVADTAARGAVNGPPWHHDWCQVVAHVSRVTAPAAPMRQVDGVLCRSSIDS